jgi:hypothetical protein
METPAPLPEASVVDRLSKAAALMLGCIYGFGFLVVSLAEAKYGIVQFNVLKPRIFAAGALFTFMIAIPTLAVRRVLRRSVIPESTGQGWLKWSFDGSRYFNMCFLLALVSYGLLWGLDLPSLPMKFSRAQVGALVVCIFLSMQIVMRFRRHYKTEPEKCRLLPFADFILQNVIVLYGFHGVVGFGRLVYWFFVVGLYAAWLDDRLRDSKKRERLYVELLLVYVLIVVTYYARFMYQGMNPSIGGGRLPMVTVYLMQKVSPFDQLQENVYLVDEIESGLYFVRNPAERQAIFVPRSSVASLQYREQSAALANK